jgi:ParB family chromosome partitioning protein
LYIQSYCRVIATPRKSASYIESINNRPLIVFATRWNVRLRAKQAALAHGEWLRWLTDNADILGFSNRRTASRLISAADKWDVDAPFNDARAVEISREIWGNRGPPRGTAGTGEFERYTPAEYIEAARAVLGVIDLDPASCQLAQRTVKAERYFTFLDDGLAHEWHGRIYLNPPYHRQLGPQFVDKLIAEYAAGNVTAAILLTNNSTDTIWFVKAATASSAVAFTTGRIDFLREDGETPLNPTQGQAFCYFGNMWRASPRSSNTSVRCLYSTPLRPPTISPNPTTWP